MSVSTSPSPSPCRMPRLQQQQQHNSPSPLDPRYKDTDDSTEFISYRSPTRAAHTPTEQHHGRASDDSSFQQISLTDDPAASLQRAASGSSASFVHPFNRPASAPRATSAAHTRSQSYSQSYSQAQSYDRNNDNYGYRPNNGLDSGAASSPPPHTRNLSSNALRPVQEYHNAFAGVDDPYLSPSAPAAAASPVLSPPPPSAYNPSRSPAHSPTPSASLSHFATLSSASRAFIEHRRQQSIPNLLPSIQSIGRNLGRAISPERASRSFQSPRPPIPSYLRNDDDMDKDSASSRDYSYCEDGNKDRDSESMYRTTDTSGPRRGIESPSVTSGFSKWLTGSVKAKSPERATILPTSQSTMPEPSSLLSRRGMANGTNPSIGSNTPAACDAWATPKSAVTSAASGSATTSPSRFSQLATSMTMTLSRFTQQQSPVSSQSSYSFEHDEFYNLDVDAAIFPEGYPSGHDLTSPAAFNNLETNATVALRRMQYAYRQRTVAYRELADEKSVCDEELEEAETRAQHLKMQLEGMARQAADQQREMQLLMDELSAEKKARAQERAMLLAGMPTAATATVTPSLAPTIVSEDLDVDEALQKQRHRPKSASWRRRSLKSNDSSYDGNYSDEEGEEGEESALDEDARSNGSSSVFSRSRSPTFMPGIHTNLDHAAGEQQTPQMAHHPRVAALSFGSVKLPGWPAPTPSTTPSATSISPTQNLNQHQPMSTFQKLVKNVASAIKDDGTDRFTTSTCSNCRGEDVSFAWNTVSVLRDENKHLKQRVGQLEVAVEGALDMVNGVGF
ncbi:hypothetical protein SEPCBS57363_001635 [Sporothrix epigloea]|uniref:Uncharacterized protein n=1 Tax=Sporothrix epigloea TaxID=1892477 RepID=A0ABP0DBN6_9PEZI